MAKGDVFALIRDDGSLSILTMAADDVDIAIEIGKLATIGINVVSHKEIKTDDLPRDRYFREAWMYSGSGPVTIDMTKARTVHMDRIREVRDEKLRQLDIETLKGIDVQAEKQVLRDIPETFDLSGAATPDDLKALWPEELA